jgi:hypothetical protein
LIPLINPHRLAPTGQWYSHEDTNSATIPTNSNSSRITYDTEASFYKFKMSFTTTISWGGGNWNGSVGCYVSDLDVGMYTSPTPEASFICSMIHRHNSGNSESEHGANNFDWSGSQGSCNFTDGGARNPYNVTDIGCSEGLANGGSKNGQIEYDGDASGGTAYFRKFDNGFGSAATYTASWNIPSMKPFRYFILAGRWNSAISASVAYRKFEWFA